jgi:flavin reductase (DIM6/NTAB) family NADH-FMN oxidoreductase RutF
MNQEKIIYKTEDIKNFSSEFRRNFINSLSGYKSVNLCGTVNKAGATNLAIFNSVIHVGAEPPLMGMIVRPPVVPRDTLNNIRETGFYTLNHVTEDIYFRAHQTAAKYDSGKSEFEIVKLTPHFSGTLPAPYVEESPVKIGLKFREDYEVKANGTIFIIGEIIETIIPKKCILSDGLLDLGLTQTITATGLDTYYATRKLARLSYARPGHDLNKIG